MKKQGKAAVRGSRRKGSPKPAKRPSLLTPSDIDALNRRVRAKRASGFDARVLARDLRRAHLRYLMRIKVDAAGPRLKVINDLRWTAAAFSRALTQFKSALESRQLALPPEIPQGLNTQSLDELIASCKAALKQYNVPNGWKERIDAIAHLGLGKGSALEFFLGALLPPIFEQHYKLPVTLRTSAGFPDTPYIRFAILVAKKYGVLGRSGKPPSRETVVKACSLHRNANFRRKVGPRQMGN